MSEASNPVTTDSRVSASRLISTSSVQWNDAAAWTHHFTGFFPQGSWTRVSPSGFPSCLQTHLVFLPVFYCSHPLSDPSRLQTSDISSVFCPFLSANAMQKQVEVRMDESHLEPGVEGEGACSSLCDKIMKNMVLTLTILGMSAPPSRAQKHLEHLPPSSNTQCCSALLVQSKDTIMCRHCTNQSAIDQITAYCSS